MAVGSKMKLAIWKALNFYPPIIPPWSRLRKDSPDDVYRLRKLGNTPCADTVLDISSFRAMVECSIWPLICVSSALWQVSKHGKEVKRNHKKSLVRQLYEQIRCGLLYNVHPVEYYCLRIFDEDRYRKAHLYFNNREMKLFLQKANNHLSRDRIYEIDDKMSFYQFCRKNGIATAPVIAYFAEGKGEWFEGATTLPEQDLFIKCTNTGKGWQVHLWKYDSGRWTGKDGRFLDAVSFIDYCNELSHWRPVIVQPRLRNHESWRGFTNGSLATLRVVTYRPAGGEPQCFSICMRMPAGSMTVDNYSKGGLTGSVDIETGLIGNAYMGRYLARPVSSHPDTGHPLQGERLTDYDQIIRLCLNAHKHTDIPWVGWDATLTESGPLIVEAQHTFCCILMQIASEMPLGETSFPRIHLEHFVR